MKECASCRVTKPIESFSRDKSRHDGLDRRCRPCHRVYDGIRASGMSGARSGQKIKAFLNWNESDIGTWKVTN